VVHYVSISQIYRRVTEPARLRGAMRHWFRAPHNAA
jgi:hypothetical protein